MSSSPLSRICRIPKCQSIQSYSKFENAKAATFSENLPRLKQLRWMVWRYQKFSCHWLSTSQDSTHVMWKFHTFCIEIHNNYLYKIHNKSVDFPVDCKFWPFQEKKKAIKFMAAKSYTRTVLEGWLVLLVPHFILSFLAITIFRSTFVTNSFFSRGWVTTICSCG